MMDGDETIWASQRKSLGQVITLFIHEYDESINGPVFDSFQQHIEGSQDLKRCIPKLFCRRKYFLGYYYFLKDYQVKLIRRLPPYKTVEDVQKLLSEYGSGSEPLGDADDHMMEVLVGESPINWSGDQNSRSKHENFSENESGKHLEKKLYPVIVRIHHSLGDGVSMNCLFIKCLMKQPQEFMKKTYDQMTNIRKTGTFSEKSNRKNILLEGLKLLAQKPYAPPILRRYDQHILHGRELSGEKILVWSQDVNSEYVQKVKEIKNRLGNGATFNSVILAAVSATFNEYFLKNCRQRKIPSTITSSLVTLPKVPLYEQMVRLRKDGTIEDMDMSNKYVVCALKLPMDENIRDEITDASWKIPEINFEIEQLKDSLDIPVLILCNRVIARLLPVPLVKLLMRGFNTTFAISNLPGFDRGILYHGGTLEDLHFWIPNSMKIGIGISIFSSNGRLEMGLIVDKVLMQNVDQAQTFLNRIVQHINNMEAAIKFSKICNEK